MKNKLSLRFRELALVAIGLVASSLLAVQAGEPKMKVGFIYVGPISDYGWTYAQDQGRLAAEKALPWVETSYVESVTEGDLESYIDQMADQGIKVIFTTSETFSDGTITAAADHPDIMFFNGSGYKRATNVGTYKADDYQCFYLEGLAAGALTKTGKIGSVFGYPAPDCVRQIDAFTIGVHEVNPKANVLIRWINSWYDPPATKEAAEALVTAGADVLISDLDSDTVAQIAEAHGLPTMGIQYGAYRAAPKNLMTGALYDWGPGYTAILKKVKDGTYTPKNLQNVDLWWRLSDPAMQCVYQPGIPLNPKYDRPLSLVFVPDGRGGKISIHDLYYKRWAEMKASPPQFEPFTGPVMDFDGKTRFPAGHVATEAELFNLTWRLPGIIGSWPTP